MSLTSRQRLFVESYLALLNGTQAAIRAGYSPRTARSIASDNLKKPAIREAIKKGQARTRKRLDGINKKNVEELTTIALANMADAIEPDGKLLPVEEWPAHFFMAVQTYKQTSSSNGIKKTYIKMQNKLKAMELLLKIAGKI